MLGWLHFWSAAKPIEGERLFMPPPHVATRTDSIDEALARDAEHMTPGKKVALGGLTALSALAAGGRSHISGVAGGDQFEIMKVWGQDSYATVKGQVKK